MENIGKQKENKEDNQRNTGKKKGHLTYKKKPKNSCLTQRLVKTHRLIEDCLIKSTILSLLVLLIPLATTKERVLMSPWWYSTSEPLPPSTSLRRGWSCFRLKRSDHINIAHRESIRRRHGPVRNNVLNRHPTWSKVLMTPLTLVWFAGS